MYSLQTGSLVWIRVFLTGWWLCGQTFLLICPSEPTCRLANVHNSPFNINTLSNKLVKDYSIQYNASERANSREYVNCLLTKNFNQITNISLKSDKIYWNINFQVFTRAFFYTTVKWVEHKSYMALVGRIYMAVLGSIIFN